MKRIIGIDPGSENSGMVVLDDSNKISSFNLSNTQLYEKITTLLLHKNVTVVVEDLAAYSLRLTPQVIDTAKFIGELVYRLKNEAGANVELIARSEVKKWCFDRFPNVCMPLIEKKIQKKNQVVASTGEYRKGSFLYVDDKIVIESLKYLYKIPLPASGKGYDFGLKSHGWQALAAASAYLYRRNLQKFVPKDVELF